MIFHNRFLNRFITALCLTAAVSSSTVFTDFVQPGSCKSNATVDYNAEMEERKTLPIESNEIENWPEGPAIGAASAILMEMNTHTILYAKNIHEKSYPASTTKILTCLLAMQNCSMDETITFSHDAIYDVPTDGSRLGGVDTGDTMLMENALYCVLVESANDVASAVGEHVAEKLGYDKSIEAFAKIMNEKAKSLGCTDTHFANANGLYDDNHYTSAYDLALIGCEFFNNELLCKMSSTPSYHFKLKADDEEDTWISSKNQLYKGKPYEYQYLLGSKTGFVSQSRQTLVSAAEKNGMKLVCVIFTEESPYQFEDTVTLFQYGFENFKKVSIDDNETNYKVDTLDLFDTENDLFGDSTPLISMENDTYVILPNTADFENTVSTLNYNDDTTDSDVLATINYTYSGVDVGSCDIIFTKSNIPAFSFSTDDSPSQISEDNSGGEMDNRIITTETVSDDTNVVFVNIKIILIGILAIAAIVILLLFIVSVFKSYSFSPKGQSSKRRRQRKKEQRAAKRQARKNARLQKINTKK
jgi:D-alanyl-D-alanine carboxypeptidase